MPRRGPHTYLHAEEEPTPDLEWREERSEHAPPVPVLREGPRSATPAQLLALQRTAGNQAVARQIDMAQVTPAIKKANRWFTREKSSLRDLLDAVDAYNAGADVATVDNQLVELKTLAQEAAKAYANPAKAKYQPTIRLIVAQIERDTKQLAQHAIDEHNEKKSLTTVQTLGQIVKSLNSRPDKAKYGGLVTQMQGLISAEAATGGGPTAIGKGKGEFKFKMTAEARARIEKEAEEAARRRAAKPAETAEVADESEGPDEAEGVESQVEDAEAETEEV